MSINDQQKCIKVNEGYLSELDSSWNSLQIEFINQLQNDKKQMSIDEIEQLKQYLQDLKSNVLTTFKNQVIIENNNNNNNNSNSNSNNNNIQVKKISNQSFEKMKLFESETADENLTEQSVMLTRDLESVVGRVMQLRQEVPRLVQQEVHQSLIKNSTITPSSTSTTTEISLHPNYQQSIDTLNNINENIDLISKDSIRTKEKVTEILKKSVNVTNATKILS